MQLLIIGSLAGQIGAASQIAMARGAKVLHAEDIEQGLQVLRAGKGVGLVMIDVTLDVSEFIVRLQSERVNVPVVACGTETDAEGAVRAIKAGAKEYVPLPPDADLIAAILSAVVEERYAMVFKDPSMVEVVQMAEQIAPSEASVLITGGSGTGKELMARHIHAKSRRAGKLFVAVNCAAIPEALLESELFGHEKGSFTGAVARRIGKFEEATGGTLLLDEISEMDTRMQAKLLRAIQEREIDRVGGTKPVKVDVRIIATSNRDMTEEVAKGTFREDLYFRINVVSLALPPLRDRPMGHPDPGRAFRAQIRRVQRHRPATPVAGSPPQAARTRLAGQCARAGKRRAPRRAPGTRHRNHAGFLLVRLARRHPRRRIEGGRRSGRLRRAHGFRRGARVDHRHAALLPG